MPLGARLWHYAAEPRTLSVSYPLCFSAHTDTITNNLSGMRSTKLSDISLFYTIKQSFKGRMFSQLFLQVVMTGAQTCNPHMREPTLWSRYQSDMLLAIAAGIRTVMSVYREHMYVRSAIAISPVIASAFYCTYILSFVWLRLIERTCVCLSRYTAATCLQCVCSCLWSQSSCERCVETAAAAVARKGHDTKRKYFFLLRLPAPAGNQERATEFILC